MKKGRLSRADRVELKRLAVRAAEDDLLSAEIMAGIGRGDDMSNILHPSLDLAPAMAFLVERLKDGATPKDAVHDLLLSDLQLDPGTRRWVLNVYTQTAEQRRRAKDRALVSWFEDLKAHLRGRGMTAKEAEESIAAGRGVKLGSLVRELTRARRRLASK